MNDIKPTYFLEVWRSPKWGICCAQRSFTTVHSFNKQYEYHEHFYGRTAIVHAGTMDYDISRKELMSMSTKFVNNDVITLQIDLKSLTLKKIEGRPSTPDY